MQEFLSHWARSHGQYFWHLRHAVPLRLVLNWHAVFGYRELLQKARGRTMPFHHRSFGNGQQHAEAQQNFSWCCTWTYNMSSRVVHTQRETWGHGARVRVLSTRPPDGRGEQKNRKTIKQNLPIALPLSWIGNADLLTTKKEIQNCDDREHAYIQVRKW